MSRASRAESRSGRESVFTRPAHLDALVARVERGESFADEHGDDDGPDRYGDRADRYGDRADRYGDRADRYGDRASRYGDMPPSPSNSTPRSVKSDSSMRRTGQEDSHRRNDDVVQLENELEDARRELEVTNIQNDHLQGQMRGLRTELELHKKHCQEFKTMLELTETDLSEAQESHSLLAHRLQLAQEASRRNSDMAQQLLTHLNTCRVDLKAKSSQNERLKKQMTELTRGSKEPKLSELSGAADVAAAHEMRKTMPPGAGRSSLREMDDEGFRGYAMREGMSTTPVLQRQYTPLTHDVAVQVELLTTASPSGGGGGKGRAGGAGAKLGGGARSALSKMSERHAQELDEAAAHVPGGPMPPTHELLMEQIRERRASAEKDDGAAGGDEAKEQPVKLSDRHRKIASELGSRLLMRPTYQDLVHQSILVDIGMSPSGDHPANPASHLSGTRTRSIERENARGNSRSTSSSTGGSARTDSVGGDCAARANSPSGSGSAAGSFGAANKGGGSDTPRKSTEGKPKSPSG